MTTQTAAAATTSALRPWDPSGTSPKQLAEYGTTMEGLIASRAARQAQREQLQQYLARTDLTGQQRGWARCAYILRQGRLPFQCKGCWLLPGNCICRGLRRASPTSVKLVVHQHVDEYSKGSNTGCLAAASLEGCELLVKGHKDHDERLQQLLQDPTYTTAVLWPGAEALEPQELQQLAAERSNGRIALIAIDATWDGANRMRKRYPPSLHMLKLPPQLTLQHRAAAPEQQQQQQQQQLVEQLDVNGQQQQLQLQPEQQADEPSEPHDTASSAAAGSIAASAAVKLQPSSSSSSAAEPPVASLFRPLRRYRGDVENNGRVCTLEAVAAALLALEGDEEMYQGLLHNLKLKVDAMRRQKHMPEVYGMLDEQ